MAYVLLVAAGLFAGYVNAIAGAGSLLTLPALIFSGLDPAAANATNRISVLTQAASSSYAFHGGGVRVPSSVWWLVAGSSVGTAAGAYIATLLDADAIGVAIAVVMVVMLALTLLRPRRDPADVSRALDVTPGMTLSFAVVGVYAGFIQAGTGVLILMLLSLVYRADLVTGNLVKVLTNVAHAVVALLVFAGSGETIDLPRGLVLAAATAAGGTVGARSAIKRGEGFVRVALTLTVLASAAKLLYDAF